MMMKSMRYVALTAVVVSAACVDATAPSVRPLSSPAPTLDIRPVQVVGMNKPAGTFYGEVWLCKQTSAGDPTDSFAFTVTSTAEDVGGTADAPTNAAPNFPNVAPGQPAFPTNCTRIYDATGDLSQVDRLVITETAKTNWAVTDIIVQPYTFNPPAQDNFPPTTFDASIDPTNRTATVRGNSETIVVVTFINDHTTPPPPTGAQGCTPGFWKNNADKKGASQWPVATSTTFESVFGVNNDLPATTTLLQALNLGGGGINALARHAAAAYLNSLQGAPDYPYTTAQVVAFVQNALSTNNYAHNQLAVANELGCPLSQNP